MTAPDRLTHVRRGKGDQHGAWGRIAARAAAQHGVVAGRQLRAAGLSQRQIDLAVQRGLLHRVHRGVFALGHARLTSAGRWSAAVLAGGPGAALGYRSAGAAWALKPSFRRTVEIVVPSRNRPRLAEVEVHCHPGLLADEATTHDGIAITTVARTLLDLAAVLSPDALRKAVAEAETLQVFDLSEIRRLLARHPRHPGRRALEHVLASWATPVRIRSVLEERFVELCSRHRFPTPLMNGTELGLEIDALFPDHGVAVELDGAGAHRGFVAREDDYARRARLGAAGWAFFAFTYRQVTDGRGRFVADMLRPKFTGRAPDPRWIAGR